MPLSRRGAGFAVVAALLAPLVLATPAAAAPSAVGAPVTVSVVVPLTVRGDGTGLLDAEALQIATSPSGVLTRALNEVLETSATIALDPRIPASVRVLGTAAPESATAWLDRLEAAPNEVFLLAYGDADLSALARADALDLTESLDFGALDPAAFGPAETATPTPATPTPTATPDDDDPPPLPTDDDLVAWPGAVARIAWPAEGTVVGGDLAAYRDAAYDGVLLDSANVSETATASVTLDGLAGIVADSASSDLFRQASAAIDDTSRQQSVDRLLVALDGLAAAHPGRSVVLTLDRSTTFAFAGLAETYAQLVTRVGTQLTGLGPLLDEEAVAARVVDGAEPDHVTRTPALVGGLAAETAFASILDEPALLVGPRRLELLELLAVAEVELADWAGRADAFLVRSREILGAVSIVDPGDLLVASTSTSIPLHVANALEFPVTVRVDVRPLRPRIRIESPVDVTIEPGSSKSVRLPAQAIANGEVVVVVSLSSPTTGVEIGQARSFTVDLQAQWETVGIVVGAVVVLVFAAGLVRNVVVRRRRAAAGDGEDDA